MIKKKLLLLVALPFLALFLSSEFYQAVIPVQASGFTVSERALEILGANQDLFSKEPRSHSAGSLLSYSQAGLACPADMVSYWKLDEGAGAQTFVDSVGVSPGKCSGTTCPVPGAGVVGGSRTFDGTDRIDVTNNPTLNWGNADSFSLEIWVNTTQDCSGNKVFMGKNKGSTGYVTWWLGCGAGNVPIFYARDSQRVTHQVAGTTAINDGNWHHLAGVRDASSGQNQLYVDGSLQGQAATSYSGNFTGPGKVTLGYFENSYFLAGSLDEAALYRRALSPAEIASHYNGGLGQSYCSDSQPPAPTPTNTPAATTPTSAPTMTSTPSPTNTSPPAATSTPTPTPTATGAAGACEIPVRIMPLGDSITAGVSSGVNDPALQVGYRKELWDRLVAAGYYIDFVGSVANGQAYSAQGFDPDHEGHGGYSASKVTKNIYNNGGANWLSSNPADIILLHIGTNNLTTGAGDVRNTLDEINQYEAATNRHVTVIVAQIINRSCITNDPACAESATTSTFNDNLETMIRKRIKNGDDLILVDMEVGAGLDYRLSSAGGDMSDNTHPFASGYAKLAAVWFNALTQVLPACGG